MRFFPKTKVGSKKKRSSFDKNVPSYEDVLIEVERQRLEKLKKKKNNDSSF